MSQPFAGVVSSPGDPSPPPDLARIRRVMVSYESSARGRAALFYALDLAQRAGAPLTVVSVATQEPVTGCGLCRQTAAFWNHERRSMAEEDLAEAARLLGPMADVGYRVAVGRPVEVLDEVAGRVDADVVVLPWEASGRLRRLFSPTIAKGLRKAARCEVIVAPRATARSSDDSRASVPAGGAGSKPA